jgi:hypothetical protein
LTPVAAITATAAIVTSGPTPSPGISVTARSRPDLPRRDLIDDVAVPIEAVPDFFVTVLGVREPRTPYNVHSPAIKKNEARLIVETAGLRVCSVIY